MAKRSSETSDNKALKTILGVGAVVGTAAAVNAYVFYKTPPLLSRLSGGTAHYHPLPDGDIFYKKAGDGPPLLLVHSIGAGCSSFEWRHLFATLAETHTVYALDLIGFGKSDKPKIAYSAETFLNVIADFCDEVIQAPTAVIASSLPAAYVVALAARKPERFTQLKLVCPTGLEALSAPLKTEGVALKTALATPVLGASFYNTLTSKIGVRKFLELRIYADPASVTGEIVTQFHTAAHQPGADHFLPYFVGGYLNCDITAALAQLATPPTIVWGEKAVESPLRYADAFLKVRPDARFITIPDAGSLPHDECPEAFLAALV